MIFVVVQSGAQGLITELSFIEEFMDESCVSGEEGYVLANIQVALQYLLTTDVMAEAQARQAK